MSPNVIKRPLWHRVIWPDAPKARLEPVVPRLLLARTVEVCSFATLQNPGADTDDLEAVALVEASLHAVWRDYISGRAQTPQECAIGRALNHIANKYMEVRHA
ncbi:MAG TPA: hypothetical protein VFS13_00705 [Steroidobacteraceae bacterium]|nr:hypothetical protein [Steroidobacteraceae bacterium]